MSAFENQISPSAEFKMICTVSENRIQRSCTAVAGNFKAINIQSCYLPELEKSGFIGKCFWVIRVFGYLGYFLVFFVKTKTGHRSTPQEEHPLCTVLPITL